MFDEIFVKTFPGFLSIRNSKHKIVYLNENFKNWIKNYTEIDPMGKTNQEIADTCEPNVAAVFTQCHDASLCWLQNCGVSETLKKVISFKDRNGAEENTQYFDVIKYGLSIDDEPHIFTIGYDITSMYKENQENLSASLTDALTGAYNRKYLSDHIGEFKDDFAVFMDLDNFKLINDYEGHDVGDDILVNVVRLLKEKLTDYHAVIRLGGDEFFVVFPKEMTEDAVRSQINAFHQEFSTIFSNYQYFSFSYGIGKVDKDIETTIIDLDEKMYLYKKTNKKHKSR